jgi:uncharacterized phiE125 gp8 family phage protein
MASEVYSLVTRAESPVTVDEVRSWLRDPPTADNTLLQLLINVATDWAEKYTARELRANTWDLLLDEFSTRICLQRDPVASITSITYLQDENPTPVPVASSVYYLKTLTQFAEVLLLEDQDWPTDVEDQEQAITVRFVTQAHPCLDQAKLAILRLVAWLYENRGDCEDATTAAKKSGAAFLLDQFRIGRV